MNFRDLTGQKFERLTAVRRVENFSGYGQSRWLFKCDCGNDLIAFGYNVAHGRQKSCGCYRDDHPARLDHGYSKSRVFHTWVAIRQRCFNKNSKYYSHYGARGIKVCDRWLVFENFLADMGEPEDGLSLDRINNDGDYEPSNCRWATKQTQVRNRRTTDYYTYNGETKSLPDWADQSGIPYKVLWHRLKKQRWTDAKLFSPLRKMAPRSALKP